MNKKNKRKRVRIGDLTFSQPPDFIRATGYTSPSKITGWTATPIQSSFPNTTTKR